MKESRWDWNHHRLLMMTGALCIPETFDDTLVFKTSVFANRIVSHHRLMVMIIGGTHSVKGAFHFTETFDESL